MQIVWKGSVYDHSGYSRATREYLLALHSNGIDVKLDLINNGFQLELPIDQSILFRQLIEKPNAIGNQVYILHQPPDSWSRMPGITIGFTYWETSKIPDHWISKCNEMDAVFVSSEHNVQVMRQAGIRVPVFKIRPCLSPQILHSFSSQIPFYIHQLPSFRFLSIFTWIERKGYDLLLKAYFEEFSSNEDVVLIIKTGAHNNQKIEELVSAESRKYNDPGRYYIDLSIRNEFEMEGLYNHCSAFVLPSRGEGIGYPMLEAGKRGLPVIATAWGGQLDFLYEQNSYLVPYHFVPVMPQPHYHGYRNDQLWAEASVEHLKQGMRNIYVNYKDAANRGNKLKSFIDHTFTFDLAAKDLTYALNQLTGGRFHEGLNKINSYHENEFRVMEKIYQLCRCEYSEFINGLYKELLLRSPNPIELEHYRNLLFSGVSKLSIIGAILQSEECSRHFNQPLNALIRSNQTIIEVLRTLNDYDDTIFVKCLYRELLFREPDEEGMQGFLNLLIQGGSRMSVIASILTSPECTALLLM
ncbi:DUF4214 domain-containing protein [Cytobacillus massiliigabonensis]|uniref:DUF4214 domain-containing protein n=1 Tax=Cytobacillus massiliigabonensis TaxID=1871011 RepID=UPI001F3C585D|nr:DUF4214 domain-containing protein [Cytobacillus massiliigabonensis]